MATSHRTNLSEAARTAAKGSKIKRTHEKVYLDWNFSGVVARV
jgi:hypothetical protein